MMSIPKKSNEREKGDIMCFVLRKIISVLEIIVFCLLAFIIFMCLMDGSYFSAIIFFALMFPNTMIARALRKKLVEIAKFNKMEKERTRYEDYS